MTIYILVILLMVLLAVLNAVVPLPGFNFFVPLFGSFMSLEQAITFITIYFLINSSVLVFVFRTYLRADMISKLLPASILGAVAGSLLSSKLNELALTFVVLAFVLFFYQRKLRAGLKKDGNAIKPVKRPKGRNTSIIGIISGFLQGGGLGGGDIRNTYLYAHNLSLQEVRATTAAVGAGIFVISLTTRTIEGSLFFSHAWLYAFAIPIAIFAAYLGRHITHKLSSTMQYWIVISLMTASIILLTLKIFRLA